MAMNNKKNSPKKVVTKQAPKTQSKKSSASKSVTTVRNMPNAIFNIDEINQLLQAVNHSNVNELKLEKGDFKITIKQGPAIPMMSMSPMPMPVAPAMPVSPAIPSAPPATTAEIPNTKEIASDNLITIKSPMIGTFYRSSGPDKPPFISVGDDIKIGQVLCIVEAMKLFNEIESEVSGTIVKVLADDSSPVEYDQPLFLVQPK